MHRDLKPDNVVYAPPAEGKQVDFDNLCLKVIDFGFSKITNNEQMKDIVGTPYYMAPEIIRDKSYSYEVDIWALGVLTYYIIEKDFPFDGKNKSQLDKRILEGKAPF